MQFLYAEIMKRNKTLQWKSYRTARYGSNAQIIMFQLF